MRITGISILISLLITSFNLYGQNLTAEEEETYAKENKVIAFASSLDNLRLQPSSQKAITFPSDFDPSLTIEGLYRLDKPTGLTDKEVLLKIYNVLNKVSTLKGIEYYSASRGHMRTLFVESARIENLNAKETLKDLQFDTLPDHQSLYVAQEDKTFGKHRSQIIYTVENNSIIMEIKNKTPMKVAFITLLKPDNFIIRLQVSVEEDHVLLYGVMSADTVKLFGLAKSKEDSFYYRLIAINDWFEREYMNTILK
ncbi:DUF6675 family protein [Spirochaeta cellobiosiphila]|uniref:DUF6675 family protein n=1 Tax=Spirochaeta cellobiosiphila TaxID=504483 RepID=UPI000404C5CF|nr:DUF6675 family protein [Spirochaeta cellobiosiphila]